MSFISMDQIYFVGLFLWEMLNFKKNLPSMLPMFKNEEMEEDEINSMNEDGLCWRMLLKENAYSSS